MLAIDDPPADAALAEPVDLDGRDRREVARHERQHARRDHRDETREERDRQLLKSSKRASSSSTRRSSSGRAPSRRRAARGSARVARPHARRRAPARRRRAAMPPSGSTHASRSKPCVLRRREDRRAELGDHRVEDLPSRSGTRRCALRPRSSSRARPRSRTRRASCGTTGRRAASRAAPGSRASCRRPRAPRARAPSAATATQPHDLQREPDAALELLREAGPVMCGGTTRPRRSTKNVSGTPVTPQLPERRADAVADVRVVDAVAARGTRARPASCRARRRRRRRLPCPSRHARSSATPARLLLARDAVRLPEVDDDDLAAQRGEAQPAVGVEARQVELRRRRPSCPCRPSARRPGRCRARRPRRAGRAAPRTAATTATPDGCASDDVDRRADVDVVEQPLGVRHLHADAAVRGAVADRGRRVGAVDPDAGRRDAHPARAERVRRPGRHRLQPLRPRARRRRVPPRVLLLDDDVEACRAASGRSPGRSRRRTCGGASRRRRASGGSIERLITITCANASAETVGATVDRVRRAPASREFERERGDDALRSASSRSSERPARSLVDHRALARERRASRRRFGARSASRPARPTRGRGAPRTATTSFTFVPGLGDARLCDGRARRTPTRRGAGRARACCGRRRPRAAGERRLDGRRRRQPGSSPPTLDARDPDAGRDRRRRPRRRRGRGDRGRRRGRGGRGGRRRRSSVVVETSRS